jgi:hypothetical protein
MCRRGPVARRAFRAHWMFLGRGHGSFGERLPPRCNTVFASGANVRRGCI